MRKKLLLIALLLAAPVAPAHAAGAFAAGQAVSSAIDQIRESANEVIHNATNGVSRGSFEMRQNTEILLQQLDIMARELEGKTFADLNATQQAFFNNTYRTLQEVKETSRYTAAQADSVVAGVESMLATLPGSDTTSRVIDFSPRYVSPPAAGTTASVTIAGSWLGSGEPSLRIGGQLCTRLEKTERKLMFTCPLPAAPTDGKVAFDRLNLTTFDRMGFWDTVLSWFGRKPTERRYELALARVPGILGSFAAVAKVESEVIEERARDETRRNDNPHCVGTRTYSWTVNAASNEGWYIAEQPSTRLIGDSDASNEGIQAWTPTSFHFQGKAKNSGSCVRVLGQIVARDGRGHVQIRADWVEKRKVLKEIEVPLVAGEIRWGQDLPIELPKGTKYVILKGTQIDGSSFEDSSTASEVRPWYRVSFDLPNNRVVIRPKPLVEALAN